MNELSHVTTAKHGSRNTFGNLVLLLISLALLGLSIRLTAANISLERALNVIEQTHPLRNSASSESEASNLMSSAADFNPLAADTWLLRAKFAGRPDSEHTDMNSSKAPAMDLSSAYFIRALRLRPQSGSLWAEYAKHGLKQRTVPTKILARLDKAQTFAPFKPSVRQTEVEIGLALWDNLNQPQRARFMASVRYLLLHDRHFVMKVAIAQGWTENLRPLLTQDAHVQELDRLLAAPPKHNSANG